MVAMFQFAVPVFSRRLILAAAWVAAALSAGVGGATWYFTRCDMADHLSQAKSFLPNPQEQYLFACGRVWHSLDGGHAWAQVPAQGLPSGLRDAEIGVDRKPGLLYLGAITNPRLVPNFECLTCAWVKVRPAIYVSHDGGLRWTLAHAFRPAAAGDSRFIAVNADPDYDSAAWVILKRGDEVAYYGTNTAGRAWQKTCVEVNPSIPRCDPPDDLLRFRHEKSHRNRGEGP